MDTAGMSKITMMAKKKLKIQGGNSIFRQSVSSGLIFILLISPGTLRPADGVAAIEKKQSLVSGATLQAMPERLTIPEAFGSIEESFQGTNGRTLLYIQDAHDCLEAQENIAKMITYLVAHAGAKTVFEEGYEGVVPTDDYFSTIVDPEIKQKVSYFLMDQLRLGGAEYAHVNRFYSVLGRGSSGMSKKRIFQAQASRLMTHDPSLDFELMGVDSLNLRQQNMEWYRQTAQHQEETAADLRDMLAKIKALANQHFSKTLKSWIKLKEKSERHEIDRLHYLTRTKALLMQDVSHEEFQSRYPNVARLLDAQKIKEPGQLKKFKATVDFKKLFHEINSLEDDNADKQLGRAQERSARTRDRQIFYTYKLLLLLNRLNAMEVTEAEYEAAKETLQAIDTLKIAKFIADETGDAVILSRRWEQNIKNAIGFYETAKKRDGAIEGSLRSWVVRRERSKDHTPQDSRPKTDAPAILVFGGFHKEAIKQILRAEGFSYYVINPRITHTSPRHQTYYKRLMSVGYHPFEAALGLVHTAVSPDRIFTGPVAYSKAAVNALGALYQREGSLSPELAVRWMKERGGRRKVEDGRGARTMEEKVTRPDAGRKTMDEGRLMTPAANVLTGREDERRTTRAQRSEVRKNPMVSLFLKKDYQYYLMLYREFFKNIASPNVLAPAGGANLSTVLLLSNATRATVVDSADFNISYTPAWWSQLDLWKLYLKWAYFFSLKFHTYTPTQVIGAEGVGLKTLVEYELQKIGAAHVRFDAEEKGLGPRGDAALNRVSFDWRHPDDPEPQKRVFTFIRSSVESSLTWKPLAGDQPYDGLILKGQHYVLGTERDTPETRLAKLKTIMAQFVSVLKENGTVISELSLDVLGLKFRPIEKSDALQRFEIKQHPTFGYFQVILKYLKAGPRGASIYQWAADDHRAQTDTEGIPQVWLPNLGVDLPQVSPVQYDETKIQEFIYHTKNPFYRLLRWLAILFLRYSHVSSKNFLGAQKRTLAPFNREAAHFKKGYALILDREKRSSRRFMASLAVQNGNLDILPALGFYEDALIYDQGITRALKAGIRDFLIIDDAALTGEQLSGAINQLAGNIHYRAEKDVTLWLAIPYLSRQAEKVIRHRFVENAPEGMKLKILPHRKIRGFYNDRYSSSLWQTLLRKAGWRILDRPFAIHFDFFKPDTSDRGLMAYVKPIQPKPWNIPGTAYYETETAEFQAQESAASQRSEVRSQLLMERILTEAPVSLRPLVAAEKFRQVRNPETSSFLKGPPIFFQLKWGAALYPPMTEEIKTEANIVEITEQELKALAEAVPQRVYGTDPRPEAENHPAWGYPLVKGNALARVTQILSPERIQALTNAKFILVSYKLPSTVDLSYEPESKKDNDYFPQKPWRALMLLHEALQADIFLSDYAKFFRSTAMRKALSHYYGSGISPDYVSLNTFVSRTLYGAKYEFKMPEVLPGRPALFIHAPGDHSHFSPFDTFGRRMIDHIAEGNSTNPELVRVLSAEVLRLYREWKQSTASESSRSEMRSGVEEFLAGIGPEDLNEWMVVVKQMVQAKRTGAGMDALRWPENLYDGAQRIDPVYQKVQARPQLFTPFVAKLHDEYVAGLTLVADSKKADPEMLDLLKLTGVLRDNARVNAYIQQYSTPRPVKILAEDIADFARFAAAFSIGAEDLRDLPPKTVVLNSVYRTWQEIETEIEAKYDPAIRDQYREYLMKNNLEGIASGIAILLDDRFSGHKKSLEELLIEHHSAWSLDNSGAHQAQSSWADLQQIPGEMKKGWDVLKSVIEGLDLQKEYQAILREGNQKYPQLMAQAATADTVTKIQFMFDQKLGRFRSLSSLTVQEALVEIERRRLEFRIPETLIAKNIPWINGLETEELSFAMETLIPAGSVFLVSFDHTRRARQSRGGRFGRSEVRGQIVTRMNGKRWGVPATAAFAGRSDEQQMPEAGHLTLDAQRADVRVNGGEAANPDERVVVFADGSGHEKRFKDWASDLVMLAKGDPRRTIVIYNTLNPETFSESRAAQFLKSFGVSNIHLVSAGLFDALKPYQFRDPVNLIHSSGTEEEAILIQSALPEELAKKLTRFVGAPGALGHGLKYLAAVKLKEQELTQLNYSSTFFVAPGIQYRSGHYVVSPGASAEMLLFQKEQFAIAFAQAA